MKGKRPAGLVQVDPDRPGGFISFLYLTPKDRGNNVGVQLLGKAISVLRPLDRDALRLLFNIRRKPTNTELIAIIADKLLLQIKGRSASGF